MNSVSPAEIAAAVAALRRGEAIGLPTETVYGLAADARNPDAIARIFALKGRPPDHPLIVHLAHASQLEQWAQDIPEVAWTLAAHFWPGPLTMILKRRPEVLDSITGGQATVGLRVPAHPVAAAVLALFGDGLAAPSANRFGRISPTTADHVRAEFGAALPIVLDGGASSIGIESTIIDLSGEGVRVLRPGQLGLDVLSAVLGAQVRCADHSGVPRVSGALDSHYAPGAPAKLVDREELERRATEPGTVILALGALPDGAQGAALTSDADYYAAHLYARLRELDATGPQHILIERVPADPLWWAIRDRLNRATFNAS